MKRILGKFYRVHADIDRSDFLIHVSPMIEASAEMNQECDVISAFAFSFHVSFGGVIYSCEMQSDPRRKVQMNKTSKCKWLGG